MSNIPRNYKVGMLAKFVAASLIGSVVELGDNIVFATKKHKITEAEQIIEQKLREYKNIVATNQINLHYLRQSSLECGVKL